MADKKSLTRGRTVEGETPIGKTPPSKELAWWYLSAPAKQVLFQERMAGRFGGTPGKAPYWHSQEVGEPGAAIEALFYIRRAIAEWEPTAGSKVSEFLRGY